eukprot:jgi/Ulvmu1/11939/UM082_0018.1
MNCAVWPLWNQSIPDVHAFAADWRVLVDDRPVHAQTLQATQSKPSIERCFHGSRGLKRRRLLSGEDTLQGMWKSSCLFLASAHAILCYSCKCTGDAPTVALSKTMISGS